jgi:hypothetical protein
MDSSMFPPKPMKSRLIPAFIEQLRAEGELSFPLMMPLAPKKTTNYRMTVKITI